MSEGQTASAPGPEHQEKHQISQWLKKHGGKVWWEEINHWNYPTFKIEQNGSLKQSKPDLVVQFDSTTVAAEFKPKRSKSSVYDALLQLHEYWQDHFAFDERYICDGQHVTVDGFVTATGNSIVGHLFNGRDEDSLPTEHYGSGRLRAIDKGELPKQEWNMTEQHVRQLWRLRNKTLDGLNRANAPALGALLSTQLDGDIDPAPAVLWKTDRGQNWRRLP